jgi:GNAT superfamily N-acetyltransferase
MTLPPMQAAASLDIRRETPRDRIFPFRFEACEVQPGQLRICLKDRLSGEEAGSVNLISQAGGRFAIYDLFVNEPYRGRFLSREIMARAARSARFQGGCTLWLEAEPGDDMPRSVLYRIYERMGFRTTRTDPQTGRPQMEAAIR